MTQSSLIAEVLTGIKRYADLGLVDETTLEIELSNELKRFGSNIMELGAKVIEIQGGKANLPLTFSKLKKAIRVDPYKVEPEIEIDDKWMTDYSVKRIVETDYEYDELSETHYKKSYKDIIYKKLIRGSKIDFHYKPTEVVALTKNFSKDFISDDCLNKKIQSIKGCSEINIVGNKIYANFREGELYIEYERLPEEDGELFIPDIPNLIKYLMSHLSYVAMRSIWINEEADAVQQKMQFFKNEALTLWQPAMTAVKFDRLPPDWNKKFQAKQKRNLRKFYY